MTPARSRIDEDAMWVPSARDRAFTPRLTDEDVERVAERVAQKLRRK